MSNGEPTASARIAEELSSRILNGELRPGTRIRQEEIAEEFGVSRVPIRESLRILEATGLVTLVASTGAWVSSLDLDACREVYLMRERLEPLLLGLAVPLHSADSAAALFTLAETLESAGSTDDFLRRDHAFHAAALAGPRAARLRELVDDLWNATHYYRLLLLEQSGPDVRQDVIAEHRMIARAIAEGDRRSAEDLLAVHIRHTRTRLEQHPELFDRPVRGR